MTDALPADVRAALGCIVANRPSEHELMCITELAIPYILENGAPDGHARTFMSEQKG